MILSLRFLLVFSTFLCLVGARNCKDGFDQIITNVKIQSNLKVGDLVHTVVLKDENVPIEDIHLVEGNGYFQLNPSNRSQLVVKFCLPAGYTELLRLHVSSCTGFVRIQVSPNVPVYSGRVTVYVSNKPEIVNVLDTNRQDINICIPETYECMVKCMNKDQIFWIDSGIVKTHVYDGIPGTDFVLDGICFRSTRALIPTTYFKITVTFKIRKAKKLKSDIWSIPKYRSRMNNTRKKHSKFVRLSPYNPNNQSVAKNNKTHNARGTNNKQISGDAYFETNATNTGVARRKRRLPDCDNCQPPEYTFPDIHPSQKTGTPWTSSAEDVANQAPMQTGSSMDQKLETTYVNDGKEFESTTELTLTSSTTNAASKSTFSQRLTEKTKEMESTSSTYSGIAEEETSGIYFSSTTSKPLTQSASLSKLTLPSTYTANVQSNSRSTTEDVANQLPMQTGSSVEQTQETRSVIDANETESKTELTPTSSTTNAALKNTFSLLSTEHIITTKTEPTPSTSSSILENESSGIFSSWIPPTLKHSTSLSLFTQPSTAVNVQSYAKTATSGVTITTVKTVTPISPVEATTHADVGTVETMWMAKTLTAMQGAPTLPDSRSAALTPLNTVVVLMMSLFTVFYSSLTNIIA